MSTQPPDYIVELFPEAEQWTEVAPGCYQAPEVVNGAETDRLVLLRVNGRRFSSTVLAPPYTDDEDAQRRAFRKLEALAFSARPR